MKTINEADYLRQILESSMDGFWMVDLEGRIREVNAAYCRMVGYTRSELLEMKISDVEGVETSERIAEHLRLIIAKCQQRFETCHRRKDNTLVELEVSTNFHDFDGGRIVGFFRDITDRNRDEERIRTSEVRYRTLFNSANDALFVLDGEQFVDCNPQAERLYGVGRDLIINRSPLDFSPSRQPDGRDSEESAREKINHALIRGGQRFEWQHCRNDGTLFDVDVSLNQMELAGGTMLLAVVRDITERKQAEEALRGSEAKFRNIVETSPMGMHLYRLDSGDRLVFTGANPAANQILNVDLDPYVGKTIEEAFPPLVHTEVPGEYRRIARHGGIWQTEQIEYKDDFISGAYEVYAFQTEPGAMAAMFLDITERKRTECALRESEERFRAIFESAEDSIFIKNRELQYTQVNPAMARLLNRRAAEIVGRTAQEIFDKEAGLKLAAHDARVLNGKISANEFNYRIGSETRTFDIIKVPLRDGEGLVIGLCGINRDITDRKKAEEKMQAYQEQLRALSSELLRTEERERRHIANDLHDSICQYLALAQIKLSTLTESIAGRELTEVKESIHNLLDLALTEARSLTNELSPPMLYHVGLEPAIISLAEQMQEQYGLRIAVHCPGEKANILDDDLRAALFRATRELLINIVKHAQTNRAEVTLRRDEGQFHIEVNDTGVGFDLADIGKQKKQEGGFGLFSIEERLNHLGGNMEISSQPGKGTRVYISVPLGATQSTVAPVGDE